MEKKIIITITDNDGILSISDSNEGFSKCEVIGLLTLVISEMLKEKKPKKLLTPKK